MASEFGGTPTSPLRQRLRQALRDAITDRDRTAVSVLRSVLAAIDNAEFFAAGGVKAGAVEVSAVGVGVAEVERKVLHEGDVAAILAREITERESAARDYAQLGNAARADQLQREIRVLKAFV